MTGTASRGSRAFWLFAAAGIAGVFATAAWLTPSPSGLGTHTQLGLAPCRFHAATGLPCPACGLTTAFAYMMRLQIGRAAAANPFGVLLFAALVVALVVAVVGFSRRHAVMPRLEALRAGPVFFALLGCGLATWFVRVAVILAQ